MELTDFKAPDLSCAHRSAIPWTPVLLGVGRSQTLSTPALLDHFQASKVGPNDGGDLQPPKVELTNLKTPKTGVNGF